MDLFIVFPDANHLSISVTTQQWQLAFSQVDGGAPRFLNHNIAVIRPGIDVFIIRNGKCTALPFPDGGFRLAGYTRIDSLPAAPHSFRNAFAVDLQAAAVHRTAVQGPSCLHPTFVLLQNYRPRWQSEPKYISLFPFSQLRNIR